MMFKKRCNYCHKPITGEDYEVHLRYPKFDGIHNEYYHKHCYDEKEQKIQDYIMATLTKQKGR